MQNYGRKLMIISSKSYRELSENESRAAATVSRQKLRSKGL